MIFKNENNYYLGKHKKFNMFNLKTGTIEKDIGQIEKSEKSDKFSSFVDYNERLLRLIKFIDTFNSNTPAVFGRIFKIKNKEDRILDKEFYSYDVINLDKNIGKLYNEVYIEFFVLDTSIDLKEITDFCKLTNVRYTIYHFGEIEENEVYLSAKYIQRLYVPDYLINFIDK